MTFETIALICTNLALLSEVITNMIYRRKVSRLLAMQNKVNMVQLDVNRLLIGIKEEN